MHSGQKKKEKLLTGSFSVHCPDTDDDLISQNEPINLNIFVSVNQM